MVGGEKSVCVWVDWGVGRWKKEIGESRYNVSVSMHAYCKELGDQTVINSNTGNRSLGFYWFLVV